MFNPGQLSSSPDLASSASLIRRIASAVSSAASDELVVCLSEHSGLSQPSFEARDSMHRFVSQWQSSPQGFPSHLHGLPADDASATWQSAAQTLPLTECALPTLQENFSPFSSKQTQFTDVFSAQP